MGPRPQFGIIDVHSDELGLDDISQSALDENIEKRNAAEKVEVAIPQPYQRQWVWRNIFGIAVFHVIAIFFLAKQAFYPDLQFATLHWFWFLAVFSAFGLVAGSHRLWAHRSYKARWPLRLFYMVMTCVAMQDDIYGYARDHRVHHKYSETDADPHNSKRGFFFPHVGWMLVSKHPEVKEKGKKIDFSDLLADPIVRFQHQYYVPLCVIFWLLIPVLVPMYFWDETLVNAFSGNIFRYVFFLHAVWLVRSVGHLKGARPYDQTMHPRENYVAIIASLGEGYHNYHHTFPWDYSGSEFGWKINFNPTTAFIDLMFDIGLAYDLKKASKDVIKQRMKRTGNGTGMKPHSIIIDHIFGILYAFSVHILHLKTNLTLLN